MLFRSDEGVGDSVEAVFAEFVFFGDGLVDWVGVDVRGHRGVEGRVEVGDVFGVREEFGGCFDDCEGGEVVSIHMLDLGCSTYRLIGEVEMMSVNKPFEKTMTSQKRSYGNVQDFSANDRT